MIAMSTVAEAFLRGVHVADDFERMIVVANPEPGRGNVWQLTVSEWNKMLDTVRVLFQFLAPHPRIEDGEVRHLAAAWHGGQSSPLYALCSTGSIVSGVQREIRDCLRQSENIDVYTIWAEREGEEFSAQAQDQAMLRRLLAYVRWHGLRGPQEGWA